MNHLNKDDVEFLVESLKTGKEIPEIYKYALFPTKQREYELAYAGKARKEDILADNDEAKAVPLQVEKIFNGTKYPLAAKNWHNLLVFGDNLQILKTFHKNTDPLIRGKVKGKVKLIYIDPPFATESDFKGDKGQKAYSDKARGAEFVEFLRRRLILMKEILADDGAIFVHLDWKKTHYIKIVLDEVFGENNFKNEIIWHYPDKMQGNILGLPKNHNVILFYSKSQNFTWNGVKIPLDKARKINARIWNPETGKLDTLKDKHGKVVYNEYNEKGADDVWTIPQAEVTKSKNTGYPTEKPESLLKRIIQATTNPGDLVLDVFAGSGTTLVVAEKLGRRWIGCDIGKLAIYTIQKRLLEIAGSKDLGNNKDKYGQVAKSFGVVSSGLYDLGKVFTLKKDEYVEFVKRLFEVEESNTKSISGVTVDGKHRESYVKIFPYWEMAKASVDEKYLQELHKNIGAKISGRFYIIVPANNVNFISDYHEINGTRYYFLKVPYQIIKELHKVQFKKLRQPQSKRDINDLDEAVGFHFIRQPEVKSEFKKTSNKATLKIKKFESAYSVDETGIKLQNFESLAMVLVGFNYNGDQFLMSEYFFAQDLLGEKDDEDDRDETQIRQELKRHKEIVINFEQKKCGKQIMVIYVDIYGNEFREIFKLK